MKISPFSKRTKIVATIGPATESEEKLASLIERGMNVMRLNFSHGSHEEHERRIVRMRHASEKAGLPIAILQDLAGPKIRIGDFPDAAVDLKVGQQFTLTTRKVTGSDKIVFVNYPTLPKEIKKGQIIFLSDGKLSVKVDSIRGQDIVCTVVAGGTLKSRAGVNVPGAYLKISSLTDKDKVDVQFGIKNDVDYIALSFVRKASDVVELKKILTDAKTHIRVIAKIETQEAIDNLDAIIAAADGVMVARGDLAVEIPAEQVPIYQKEIIKKCNRAGKPVITATQMLSSMMSSPVPTRAEVNDIANAILDGTDAVMLSEETTLGKHPEEAVTMMARVALQTEQHFPYEDILKRHHLSFKDITGSVSYAVVNTAHEMHAKAIVALSMSGFTARMISRYKPNRPIIVITPNKKTYNQMALSFNCYPVLTSMFKGVTDAVDRSKAIALEHKVAIKGNRVVLVGGIPFGKAGSTNMLMVQKL